MKRLTAFFTIFLFSAALYAQDQSPKRLSDNAVKKVLIKASVDAYSGNCACPYNRASNGSKCGKRSAYSKPGGAEPLCYKRDVTEEMVAAWRATNEKKAKD